MAQSPLGAQFHEAVARASLRLIRLAKANRASGEAGASGTDGTSRLVNEGLSIARSRGLIDDEGERFILACLDLDARLVAGEITPEGVSYEEADRLERLTQSI